MATRDAKEKELWAAFAVAAAQAYNVHAADVDGAEEAEEAVDDAVEFCSAFADGMLDAMDARYTEKGRRAAKRRGKDADDDDDEDDD